MLVQVWFFIAPISIIIVAWLLMGVFFDKRRTALWVLFLSFLLFIYSPTMVELLIPITVFPHILLNTIALFVITLNYESTTVRRILAVVTVLLFIAIMHVLSIILIPTWDDVTVFRIMAMALLPITAALLLRKGKYLRKQNIPSSILLVYTLFFSAIVAFFITFFIVTYLTPDMPPILMFLALGLGVAICVLVYSLYNVMTVSYDNRLKSTLYAQEKEHYFVQAKLMQESADKIRSIHHDMMLHFATLRDYTIGNQVATDYLNHLLSDIDKSDAHINTGNITVDSIINYKLKDVSESDINLDLNVAVPPELNIEASDITIILGNLLDNALEALANVQDDKRLGINVKIENGGVFIKVENTFDGNVKYAGKAGKEGQITTIKSEDGHGYGLKNIQQCAKKYNGYVKISHEGKVFSVMVYLYA